ncbi:MAG: GTPase Era [Actinobacteria bacterium]|nr:GTPase Era [Actinomycetota bacterium]
MEGRELDLEAILGGGDDGDLPEGHRAGMVGLVGRPNVGKSTLLNAMVGQKVAIVTQVPGTTRNTIRGVVTRQDAQLVFLDTPGIAKPKTLLTKRLNDLVRDSWSGMDVICFLVDVAGGVGSGDEKLAEMLAGVRTPVVAVANKEDLVTDKHRMIPQLQKLSALREFDEIVPVSATQGMNVDHLVDVLVGYLPEGPRFFADGYVTDQPERQLAAEILREKLIASMAQEVPHSIMVTVDEIAQAEHRDDLLEIDAVIHVERDSQKGIVLGKGGSNLKRAATEARTELEILLGAKVFLRTHVKVAKDWQRDPRKLGRFGY